MKNKRRVTLKLRNHTPKLFQLWKDIESDIGDIFKSYGVIQSNIVYTSKYKLITIEYDSFEVYSEAVICAAQFGASKGLELEQVSVVSLETKEDKCQDLIEEYKGKNYEAPKLRAS